MPNIFEKRLSREETDELLVRHPDQERFLKIASNGSSWFTRELSDDYAISLVTENPDFIERIGKPTEAVCLAAVKANPRVLRKIQILDQTDAVCREAMKGDIEMIGFLCGPTKDECLEAVRANPGYLHILTWCHESVKSRPDRLDVYVEAALGDINFGETYDGELGLHWRDSWNNRYYFYNLDQVLYEIAQESVMKCAEAGLGPEEIGKAARACARDMLESHEASKPKKVAKRFW